MNNVKYRFKNLLPDSYENSKMACINTFYAYNSRTNIDNFSNFKRIIFGFILPNIVNKTFEINLPVSMGKFKIVVKTGFSLQLEI